MAALVAGVQYGLSSHKSFYENKSLIFVKLTDSAQRSIETYVKNQNKIHQNPTIQFLGNKGQLSFPCVESSYNKFIFSISNNQGIDGPQGGFECVQQTGPENLESLGTLPCKMRIQANDDVYETTRHRMHAAEENNKNKCTQVIKAGDPVNRKFKVKGSVKNMPVTSQIMSNVPAKHRDLLISSIGNHSKKPPCKSTYNSSYRLQLDTHKKASDVVDRSLKERLIHLLAIKPLKKCDLYDRIKKEGLRDKEKTVDSLLKKIASIRENTYYLNKFMWNEVQEDWPFYTEQEKIILKKKKAQNLTSPSSSDGNGQSPTSTHPGSPTSATTSTNEITSSKRPGYYQGNDGLPTKRQRISHYRKPELDSLILNDIGKSNFISGTFNNNYDQKFQNQEQNNFELVKSSLTSSSDYDEDNINLLIPTKLNSLDDQLTSHKINCISHNIIDSYGQDYSRVQEIKFQEFEKPQDVFMSGQKEIDSKEFSETYSMLSISKNLDQDSKDSKTFLDKKENCDKDLENKYTSSFIGRKSLDCTYQIADYSDNNTTNKILTLPVTSCRKSPFPDDSSEYSDYLTYYTTINTLEQRTRYKAEFNAYFREYQKLHVQVVKISKYFTQLEEELNDKLETGNTEECEAIKHKIVEDYEKTKKVHARFYYLHDKLGHIKKLVSEYDFHTCISPIANNNAESSVNDISNDHIDANFKSVQCTFTQLHEDKQLRYRSNITQIS